ncbi:Leucine-rich repeat-containing protein 57 [Lamellibrachia satsuma]|nr:Leucine-rich repeat-containing protein 57 [Lamellibrachia satsuma]
MGNSIKPHIDRAEKTGTCNLAKQGLDEFPAALQKVTGNLRTLDLADNKLPSLPPLIGSYNILKHLNVSGNRLAALPPEIGNLKKLESLTLNNNRLTSLPQTLCHLSSLRDINLSNNQLRVFPTQLGGLKALASVDLSHNRLVEVPAAVKEMNMIELNLNRNSISRLSEEVGDCPRLKVLRLEENCLEVMSFTPRIMKHSNISLLAIEGNVFEMKAFHQQDGYDEYMERYTATKKKFT